MIREDIQQSFPNIRIPDPGSDKDLLLEISKSGPISVVKYILSKQYHRICYSDFFNVCKFKNQVSCHYTSEFRQMTLLELYKHVSNEHSHFNAILVAWAIRAKCLPLINLMIKNKNVNFYRAAIYFNIDILLSSNQCLANDGLVKFGPKMPEGFHLNKDEQRAMFLSKVRQEGSGDFNLPKVCLENPNTQFLMRKYFRIFKDHGQMYKYLPGPNETLKFKDLLHYCYYHSKNPGFMSFAIEKFPFLICSADQSVQIEIIRADSPAFIYCCNSAKARIVYNVLMHKISKRRNININLLGQVYSFVFLNA